MSYPRTSQGAGLTTGRNSRHAALLDIGQLYPIVPSVVIWVDSQATKQFVLHLAVPQSTFERLSFSRCCSKIWTNALVMPKTACACPIMSSSHCWLGRIPSHSYHIPITFMSSFLLHMESCIRIGHWTSQVPSHRITNIKGAAQNAKQRLATQRPELSFLSALF